MRASDQEQKGGIGANEVAAKFERIGWGTAENSKHDLGTDLFLMARDARLVDLGMIVGAQVKAGPSYFTEPEKDHETNAVTGWWYRESKRDHFDAWLEHQLPHIIALHDLENEVSYWAHITADAVMYLGKGAKIFIPANNTIDADHADELISVAASRAPRAMWEGSAWAGAERLSPSHQLRYALLAPRLIAPHPNQGDRVKPSPVQAIAMLVQVRIQDLSQMSTRHDSVPNLEALDGAAGFGWQLATALRSYLLKGDPDTIKAAVEAAAASHEQAAATVMYAAGLLEDARASAAHDVLLALLQTDTLDRIDHAWVQLQYARTLADLGHREEARDQALSLVGLGASAPGDITASAIAGAAANLVFVISDWGAQDLERTIATSDTTASWWSQQVLSWGLSAQAEKTFKRWARDTSVTIGGTDSTWRYLRSASLMAGFLGDHDAWRHCMKLLGDYILSDDHFGAEPEMIASALTTLRLAGDEKSMRLATRRLLNGGPAAAVINAAENIHPENSTRTTAHADLVMLVEAADLLPQLQADKLGKWAMSVFIQPDDYVRNVRPGFSAREILIELLKELVHAVGPTIEEELVEFILALPAQPDQMIAHRLGPLVEALPERVWSEDRARRAADRADADNWELQYSLLGVAAQHIDSVRERLLSEASSGSLTALAALGDVTRLDATVVKAVIAGTCARLNQQIEEVRSGRFSVRSHNLGRTLAVLNVWHPEHADWGAMCRLLESTHYGQHIAGALAVLATRVEALPQEVARRLIPRIRSIADGPDPEKFLLTQTDPRPHARQLLAAVERRSGGDGHAQIAFLARGNADERRTAAFLCRDPNDSLTIGVLTVLTGDSEPHVRATAATVIAERAANGDTVAASHLCRLSQDPGVLVPRALADVAATHPSLRQREELAPLASHPSARVRAIFGNGRDR